VRNESVRYWKEKGEGDDPSLSPSGSRKVTYEFFTGGAGGRKKKKRKGGITFLTLGLSLKKNEPSNFKVGRESTAETSLLFNYPRGEKREKKKRPALSSKKEKKSKK